MRVQEWTFDDPFHPVYERDPAQDTRWIDPLPMMRARAYTPYTPPGRDVSYPQSEPLRMDMVGHPSVDIHQSANGNTVQTVRLYSRYAAHIDLGQIQRLARQWLRALESLSQGTYTLADLRKMGHPYGYGATSIPSWSRLRAPRAIPGFRASQRRGARGFLPNRAVVNSQSGQFLRSWRFSVNRFHGGVTLNFWNEAKSERGFPYPWALAHGTIKMQAHGPWPFVADELLDEVHEAWRQGAWAAWHELQSMRDQFGDAPVQQQLEDAEAGGWG